MVESSSTNSHRLSYISNSVPDNRQTTRRGLESYRLPRHRMRTGLPPVSEAFAEAENLSYVFS